MKEPVKATSGVFYEKSALEELLMDGIKCDRFGNPFPLSLKDNMGLPVDHQMKTMIYNWIKDNDYHKNDEEDNEKASIILFLRKKKILKSLSIHLISQKTIKKVLKMKKKLKKKAMISL